MGRENLLTLQCMVQDGIGLMQLSGELLAESRYEPERVLREWLEAGVTRVIIGFEEVTHIDSAGFSILLGALHRYRRHEGDLLLAGRNPHLASIFEVTSMERYFKMFDSVEAATSHFQQAAKPRRRGQKVPD